MYIGPVVVVSNPFCSYPTPPSLASSDASYQVPEEDHPFAMGANNNVNVAGVGILNYQRALDVARNTEGELDPAVSDYLESALYDIWRRINVHPDTYIMTKDEFAIFNYYRRRFEGDTTAEQAVARYWTNTYEAPSPSS